MRTKRVLTQTFVVVGAIIEYKGKFCLVKENTKNNPDYGKWNHPAGWLEVGEHYLDGVKKEVKEEAGLEFIPEYVLGVYMLERGDIREFYNNETPYCAKIIFTGAITEKRYARDAEEISEVGWFTPEEIFAMDQCILRDMDIKVMIEDYREGTRYPLGLLHHFVQYKNTAA